MDTKLVELLSLLCLINGDIITTNYRIAKLLDDLKVVNEIIDQQRMALIRINTKLETSESDLNELMYYHKGKRQAPNSAPIVGFAAAITQNKSGLQKGQTLIYETILTNMYIGYSNTTGMFTCPVSGLYQFAASIVSSGQHENRVDAEMVIDGAVLLHLSAHEMGYDTGSHVVIIHCNQNQNVWVRHVTTVHGSNQMLVGRPSYFSGHLINAD